MRPIQAQDGSWVIIDFTGSVLAKGLSNAAAWKYIDRHQRDREGDAFWRVKLAFYER